ncbi:MAG: beta-ketoacyl-ACP synthase 3 [Paludibacteraceae bacterium]|nr:beta-ketoacyl-ACP synthase 3 [Paludibacteraceae bacterium]
MKISGTGVALPQLRVTNDMIAQYVDTSDEWISSRTGIKERPMISTESLIDLGAKAAKDAIAKAGLAPTDIDLFICSNVVNSYVTPSLACIIQGEIGATCPCFDINNACAGFMTAMDMADGYISSGKYKNILVVCAEEPSRIVDWKSRDACILFGDAASAAVLTAGDSLKTMKFSTKSMPDVLYYRRKLEYNPFLKKEEFNKPLQMNGRDVFKTAVSFSSADIKEVVEATGWKMEDVDMFVLHQANLRIIEAIRQRLDLPDEKVPHNVERMGNTSSACIPILLNELIEAGKIKKGDKLVFSAFGAGFSSAACTYVWE